MIDVLNDCGWYAWERQAVNSRASAGERTALHFLRRIFAILSGPGALFGGSLARIAWISSARTFFPISNWASSWVLAMSARSAGFGGGKKCSASI